MMNKRKAQNLQLYLHIPFCVRKCAYCDFLSGPADPEEINAYVEAVIKEISSYGQQYSGYEVSTIFLGGGTPSILTETQMKGVFLALRNMFQIRGDAEITVEMNPGTVTREKLSCYREIGINRLSIGLQSVNDEELKLLGRIHTMQDFLSTYQMAREEGFQNINIDLISAIPGQTPKSWIHTLKTVADLNPEHISAYSLIVEEGTPFYERYGEQGAGKGPELPSEEDERKIYQETQDYLNKYQYERYEISNYAKPGFKCHHNMGYWERENYLGIGVGAASMIENQRFQHVEERKKYEAFIENHQYEKLIVEKEVLSKQAQMEEFMFLGLREMKGISKAEFQRQFHLSIEAVYGAILEKQKQDKLILEEDGWIRLTEYGIDISNYVMSQYLLA